MHVGQVVRSHQKLFKEKLNLFNFFAADIFKGFGSLRIVTKLDSYKSARARDRWRCIGDVHEEEEMHVFPPPMKEDQTKVIMMLSNNLMAQFPYLSMYLCMYVSSYDYYKSL